MEKEKTDRRREFLNRAGDKAALAAIALAVLLCEIFVMNYKHWGSIFCEPVENVTSNLYGMVAVDGRYEISDDEAVAEFTEIGKPVAYLAFSLEEGQQAEIAVAAVDEANAAYLWAPVRIVRGDVDRSQYLALHFSGDVQKLKVVIRGMQGDSIRQDAVTLNARVPLFFSWRRYLLLTVALWCLYLLRPGSRFYEIRTDMTRRRQWLVAAACIGVQMLFFHGMLRWNTGALAWPEYMEHHQQYYRLAEALLEGHVDIGEEPILLEVENPYDTAARAAAGLNYGWAKWDHAYYNGRYYVYFGVVPVLLFYLPFYVLTGTHLPHVDCIFLLGGLLMAGIAWLMWQIIRRWFPGTPYVVYLLLSVVMGAASGLGYAVYKPDLYLVPILAGIVCGVWGLGLWISAERPEGYATWRLGAGALCLALIAGCRPQLLLILAVGPILFGRAVFRERKLFTRESAAQTLSLCLPFVIVAAGVMYYNALRFGSPLDFGASYNLTTNDMTHRGWVWGRCGLGIFSYLLQPPRISAVFPFLQDFSVETAYQGLTLSEKMVGGVLWLFPVLCFGVYGLFKRGIFKDIRCYRMVWACQLLMVALVVTDSQMAGLLTRYFGDFVWIGMIGSILVILACYDRQAEERYRHHLQRLVTAACCATLILVFLRIFAHSEDSIRMANPALYYEVQSLIAFWM
ncbi:MAG: hypothetical protein HDR02_02950 [Lachnospiraceae bacterium]|nr:hypothetical protein [Lachnospiraceae bacterium]